MARVLAHWVLWWATLAAIWLLLTDTVRLEELVVGAAAAALAAGAALAIGGPRPGRPRVGLGGVARALARVPLDTGILARALWRRAVLRRRSRGRLRAIRFRSAGAAAEWLNSLGPNSYVIGIDRDRKLMLVHQLEPPSDPSQADPAALR